MGENSTMSQRKRVGRVNAKSKTLEPGMLVLFKSDKYKKNDGFVLKEEYWLAEIQTLQTKLTIYIYIFSWFWFNLCFSQSVYDLNLF